MTKTRSTRLSLFLFFYEIYLNEAITYCRGEQMLYIQANTRKNNVSFFSVIHRRHQWFMFFSIFTSSYIFFFPSVLFPRRSFLVVIYLVIIGTKSYGARLYFFHIDSIKINRSWETHKRKRRILNNFS